MERDPKVSVQGTVLAAVLLLALTAAYLVGAGSQGGAPASAAGDQPAPAERRTVVMTGVGTATAVPDEVGFSVSVGLTRADLSTALDAASATTARVLGRLADFGVAEERVQTTGLSMYPVYDYPTYGPRILRGYRVTQSARVTVPRLHRAGKAIAAAVRAGGNAVRVSNIRLIVGDRATVLAEARDAAVAEATEKAGQYAVATGQTLGRVLDLREVRARGARPAYPVGLEALRGADLASVPIRAGEDELRVTVRVVWSFG